MHIRNYFLFVFLMGFAVSKSQQTFFYTDKNAGYKKGLLLFSEKNYASARNELQSFANTARPTGLIADEINYMIAVSAAENNDSDAEKLLNDFSLKNSDSYRTAYINFYLGRYYYLNNKYQECIDKLAELRDDEIPDKYRTDHKFQLAYCYFVKKKFDEAQPLFASIKNIKEKYYYPSNYYYAFISFYKQQYNDALNSFLLIEDSKMFSSVIPYYVSQIYYLKKDYPKTIDYIKKHVEKIDILYTDEMNHLLGECYFQLSDYGKALPLLESRVAKGEKVRKEDIYELAYSQYKTGKYDAAVENFLQLNLMDDTLGQNATYALADCYLILGDKEKAKAAFQSASTKTFDTKIKEEALFNYAKLSLELGNPQECVNALKQLLSETNNHKEEADELMAVALLQTKDYSGAFAIIESLPSLSPSLKQAYQRTTYSRAVQLFNDGELKAAKELFNKSLKYPIKPELQNGAYFMKGEIAYREQKYTEAYEYYQKFIDYVTQNDEAILGFSKTLAEYNVAYSFFKQKKYERALQGFRQVIKTENIDDATLRDAQLRTAECAFITKSFPTALTNYNAVANSTSPEAEYAQFQKGIVLGLQDKNSEKIAALKELTQRFPNSKIADKTYFEIGNTYLDIENSTSAITHFNALIDDYPKSALVPAAYLRIGLAQYNLNEKEKALAQYKYVIANYPSSPEAKQAVSAIKDLGVELGRPDEYTDIASISDAEKDSLTWEAAQIAYDANDCYKAIPLFGKYLDKFPKGFFAQQAHFLRSECYLKQKNYVDILADYDALIANSPAYKERALLNASGIAYFELKDYAKALNYYKQLSEVSTSTQNTYTAIVGALKSAEKTSTSEEIILAANKILSYSGAKESDLLEAHYLKAKIDYATGNRMSAYVHFDAVANVKPSERAAEAKYMTAKILNENKEYKASLDTCFKIKNKFSSYEIWYLKNFILMADNYYRLDNVLQAKATLESIVANYKGEQSLLDEATKKLDEINNEELKKSQIQVEMPSDTLQMEQPKTD